MHWHTLQYLIPVPFLSPTLVNILGLGKGSAGVKLTICKTEKVILQLILEMASRLK